MLIKGIREDSPVLGKVVDTDGVDDVLLKMQFSATEHVVKMYNYVYISSMALRMQNIDPGNADQLQVILNEIYQKYQRLRNELIKSEPEAIIDHDIEELIRGYCSELEQHSLVLKYWVTIHFNDRVWDSKKMGLHK